MTNTLKGMDAQVKDPAAAGKNVDEAAAAARDLSQAEAGAGGRSGPPGAR